jgi:hypothetical protein
MAETSDDSDSGSEKNSQADSSNGDQSSSSSNSGERADRGKQQGFKKLMEQKITNFFRLKPREKMGNCKAAGTTASNNTGTKPLNALHHNDTPLLQTAPTQLKRRKTEDRRWRTDLTEHRC